MRRNVKVKRIFSRVVDGNKRLHVQTATKQVYYVNSNTAVPFDTLVERLVAQLSAAKDPTTGLAPFSLDLHYWSKLPFGAY
tara:strand:+ start:259 stop:501 length:243 start_codon:yes stop_codon:yes gene_type:complete